MIVTNSPSRRNIEHLKQYLKSSQDILMKLKFLFTGFVNEVSNGYNV